MARGGRRTVVENNVPRERRCGQRLVLLVGGVAAEANRVADLPCQGGRRSVDNRSWGRVGRSNCDGERRTRACGATAVRHSHRRVVGPVLSVRVEGADGGGIAVRAVAIQVPRILERSAYEIAGAARVEVDL